MSIQIQGSSIVCGLKIPKISGGFGQGKKSMLAKSIAGIHGKKTMHVTEAVNINKSRFVDNVDIVDLKNKQYEKIVIGLVDNKYLSRMEVSKSESLYLFSERGYAKLLKIFDDDLAWDKYDEILDGYFRLRDRNETSSGVDEYLSLSEDDRAIAYFQQRKEMKTLELMSKELENRVTAYAPKVAYLDTILQSKATVTTSQIGADYGLTAQELNKILKDKGVQRKVNGQWLLYKKYSNKGYTQSSSIPITRSSGNSEFVMNTRWTQRGRLFIHEILTELGYKANIEKEYQDAR